MNRKKALKILVISLGICGLALASIPFLLSLGPSATAGSTLPRLDIKGLGPGDFSFYDNQRQDSWTAKYLVIKEHDGSINVLMIRTKDSSFIMPDNHWWNLSGFCKKFTPEMKDSKIAPGGVLKCFDADLDPSLTEEWQWSYTGKSRGRWVSDLYSPTFTVENDAVIIGKPRKTEAKSNNF